MAPMMFTGLIIGAMMPFLFSALTMTAVGDAAEAMIKVIREDFAEHKRHPEEQKEPDVKKCIEVATNHALQRMILPGVIVIVIPILIGILFGPNAVVGYLSGVIISGIQMAISMSNTGGAWDNTKKSIKSIILY
ncbi:MAG: sodium/proton-translocating pyrophosphatase [bacterium]|nr:sodium/proton-translocating pyrophosphatase [bacterium]